MSERWRARLREWLREPLVHFLIAGLAVFGFSMWRGEEVDSESRRIVITADKAGQLALGWQTQWRRPPSPQELDGLIRDYVQEEVYVREALRLGLDADDPVIRRQLRQKMEFLARSGVEGETPSDAELQAWFAQHSADYAGAPRMSFDQAFLGDMSASDATALRERLNAGANPSGQGAAIDLPRAMEGAAQDEVGRIFGEDFARAVAGQPVGRWAGPVSSGFGAHLVRLRKRDATPPPSLANVRQRVENDWRAATAATREAAAYQTLLDGYTIRIEKP